MTDRIDRKGGTGDGSMSMVERIARAMAIAEDEDYMEFHREWDRRARAALEAMKEPTEAMEAAAESANKYWSGPRLPVSFTWQTMITAALTDEAKG